jgi:tetratricopeptide (TPR) repeat protein
MGDFYLRLGDAKKAEEYYIEDLRISRILASLDEGNTDWQQNLATSLSKMGDFLIQQGDGKGLDFFFEAKQIHEKLLQVDSSNVNYLFDYALDFMRIGNVLRMMKNEHAKSWLENAREILEQLCERAPEVVEFREHLEVIHRLLNALETD